ncbi:hypothetical protein PWT90_11233 [Aphanocladium album]|nr:hypothetical protein PWT90_11233 [Aphanocladium album]
MDATVPPTQSNAVLILLHEYLITIRLSSTIAPTHINTLPAKAADCRNSRTVVADGPSAQTEPYGGGGGTEEGDSRGEAPGEDKGEESNDPSGTATPPRGQRRASLRITTSPCVAPPGRVSPATKVAVSTFNQIEALQHNTARPSRTLSSAKEKS